MRYTRTLSVAAMALSLGLAGAGCSSGSATVSTSRPQVTTITVGAASSLTDVFVAIADSFTQANPDIAVRFSFAGSSAIAEQINQGAPIDVFASAGASSMQPLADGGQVTGVTEFARNTLVIAVPSGNPARVTGLADLAAVSVVVCQEQVPCGVAAQKLFEANAVPIAPVSLEPDVRSVLAKIEADEADAGIVYVTDVKAVDSMVVGIEIPADQNVTSVYQAGVVAESANAGAAASFVAYLVSPEAQAALAAAGFAPPS